MDLFPDPEGFLRWLHDRGMKVTLNARVPYAILAESRVLATAPVEMLQSGYGDIIGKYSALNDWRLSQVVPGSVLNFIAVHSFQSLR